MKRYIRLAILASAVACTFSASAQNTVSGYFVDDYTYRFQMNPAVGNSQNFVAMPGLGNINVGVGGNLAVSDVLYNVDGRTTTFLNPGVSVQEVMDNLSGNNHLNADVKIGILAGGFKAFGGYNTVAVNVRSGAGVNVPREIFSLLKEGATNATYDISDFGAFANAYAEVALGHSHNINKEWRIGGAVKFLVGGANIDARFNKARLTLGVHDWSVEADADLNTNIKGAHYKTKMNDRTGHTYVNGIDVDNTGINGFGVAFDLGATFTPAVGNWEFSASVLDLGFIKWNNDVLATTDGLKSFHTDRYTFNVDGDASNSFKNEWDRIRDDLSAIYELEDRGDQGSQTRALGATLHFGAAYTLPAYDKLKFGLLNTTRAQGRFSWTEFRLSANIAPCKCFSAGVNFAMGTFGPSFGWIANVHTTGFNLFLGMDHIPGKLAKQGVPLSSNAKVNLGINFPF